MKILALKNDEFPLPGGAAPPGRQEEHGSIPRERRADAGGRAGPAGEVLFKTMGVLHSKRWVFALNHGESCVRN